MGSPLGGEKDRMGREAGSIPLEPPADPCTPLIFGKPGDGKKKGEIFSVIYRLHFR